MFPMMHLELGLPVVRRRRTSWRIKILEFTLVVYRLRLSTVPSGDHERRSWIRWCAFQLSWLGSSRPTGSRLQQQLSCHCCYITAELVQVASWRQRSATWLVPNRGRSLAGYRTFSNSRDSGICRPIITTRSTARFSLDHFSEGPRCLLQIPKWWSRFWWRTLTHSTTEWWVYWEGWSSV